MMMPVDGEVRSGLPREQDREWQPCRTQRGIWGHPLQIGAERGEAQHHLPLMFSAGLPPQHQPAKLHTRREFTAEIARPSQVIAQGISGSRLTVA